MELVYCLATPVPLIFQAIKESISGYLPIFLVIKPMILSETVEIMILPNPRTTPNSIKLGWTTAALPTLVTTSNAPKTRLLAVRSNGENSKV